MKKYVLLFTVLLLTLLLALCNQTAKHSVTVNGSYSLLNTLKDEYAENEEVAIVLPTETEAYYTLSVNGKPLEAQRSDLIETRFVFSMPDTNVVVEINVVDVPIPETPQE